MGMGGRFSQYILDRAPRQAAGALVLFQYDIHFDAGSYIRLLPSAHWQYLLRPLKREFKGKSVGRVYFN